MKYPKKNTVNIQIEQQNEFCPNVKKPKPDKRPKNMFNFHNRPVVPCHKTVTK